MGVVCEFWPFLRDQIVIFVELSSVCAKIVCVRQIIIVVNFRRFIKLIICSLLVTVLDTVPGLKFIQILVSDDFENRV